MIIETRKMGKWRRWVAKVYLPGTRRTLNEELVEKGLEGGLKNMLAAGREGAKLSEELVLRGLFLLKR